MVPLGSLWLPILVAAVLVFLASSLIHMVLPIHKTDWKKVPDEDAMQEAVRRLGITPGDYTVPCGGSSSGMKEPAFIERMAKGPIVFMTVIAGGHTFLGTSLASWFLYCIVVSVFGGYVAGRALAPGANYLDVFDRHRHLCVLFDVVAAVVDLVQTQLVDDHQVDDRRADFGMLTAGTFGWLWPR